MRTYTEAGGHVLDLSEMTAAESRYFEKALAAYRAGVPWAEFCQFTQAPENPALEAGRATRRSIEHPLFLALLDMEARLGVRQGYLRKAPGWDINRDPFDDEEVSIVEAARERGVSRQTLYTAIDTGDLVGTRHRPARISRNSLARWRPMRVRRSAVA